MKDLKERLELEWMRDDAFVALIMEECEYMASVINTARFNAKCGKGHTGNAWVDSLADAEIK